MPLDLTPLTPQRYTAKLAMKQRGDLQEVTAQIATQQRHEDYAGFAQEGTLQSLVSLKSEITQNKSFITSNDNALAKLNIIDGSMGRVQDAADELVQLVTRRINSASGGDIPVEEMTGSLLGRFETALNASYNGHYLFGGSKSDAPPVQNIEDSNMAGDLPTSSYYKGDAAKATVRGSAAGETVYGVNADAESFRKLIGAAHLLLEGHQGDDYDKLNKAMAMAGEALDLLTADRATVRGNMDSIRETKTTLEDAGVLMETSYEDIYNVDIVEAATRMSELEASVQASYTAWSRLNRLRLSDYL